MTEVRCLDISRFSSGDYAVLYAEASEVRKRRADRYLRQEDRVRCVAADALLRLVPGYREEELACTPAGKLYFKSGGTHFNLSHSGRWVVVAWGSDPVGIDVEQLQMDSGKLELARRYFCEDEQDYLFAAPPQEQAERFYRIWTGKESYLKYLGTGIDRPLQSFSVLKELPETRLHTHVLKEAFMTVCSKENIHCCEVTLQQLLAK